jgi:hypothetical protein
VVQPAQGELIMVSKSLLTSSFTTVLILLIRISTTAATAVTSTVIIIVGVVYTLALSLALSCIRFSILDSFVYGDLILPCMCRLGNPSRYGRSQSGWVSCNSIGRSYKLKAIRKDVTPLKEET